MADVQLNTLTASIKTALGISGDAVGTTDPQTLSNKNIPAGSNTITGLTSSDVGLGNVVNADTTTTANITDSSNKRFMTDAQETKLDSVESGATADQTGAEIKTAYEGESNTNAFTDAEQTKLSGIESGAEVNTIDSDPTGVTGADQVTNVMSLTQAEYDAIGTPGASTFYIITDA